MRAKIKKQPQSPRGAEREEWEEECVAEEREDRAVAGANPRLFLGDDALFKLGNDAIGYDLVHVTLFMRGGLGGGVLLHGFNLLFCFLIKSRRPPLLGAASTT
jgi:hypothetical protein